LNAALMQLLVSFLKIVGGFTDTQLEFELFENSFVIFKENNFLHEIHKRKFVSKQMWTYTE